MIICYYILEEMIRWHLLKLKDEQQQNGKKKK